MRPYTDIAGLEAFYLEESYVLDVEARPGVLRLTMDLVLTPAHPLYRAPRVGEQFCVVRGALSFDRVTSLVWVDQGRPPALDAAGEVDYGQLDSFEWDDAGFKMEGFFGRIAVVAASVAPWIPHDYG